MLPTKVGGGGRSRRPLVIERSCSDVCSGPGQPAKPSLSPPVGSSLDSLFVGLADVIVRRKNVCKNGIVCVIMLKCGVTVVSAGWCSAHPRLSLDKYGIPCQEITLGDVCLPPNHPEAVRTPDLCDRFKKFEFSK